MSIMYKTPQDFYNLYVSIINEKYCLNALDYDSNFYLKRQTSILPLSKVNDSYKEYGEKEKAKQLYIKRMLDSLHKANLIDYCFKYNEPLDNSFYSIDWDNQKKEKILNIKELIKEIDSLLYNIGECGLVDKDYINSIEKIKSRLETTIYLKQNTGYY